MPITLSSTPETLSPSQLNRSVKSLLESHFDFVWVEGELSNFAQPSSGHWYFTLKDESAQVRCAMFRNRNVRLRFTPKNGDQLRLRARVSLYEGRGEFQLIGEFMEPAGTGALQAQFEALRDRLREEGLFDTDRKQELPEHARHLAIVTSATGAALQDILQVLERRNPAIRISVLPAMVQGKGAAAELRQALARAADLAKHRADCDFDAIILARGGGSLEDLWAFNDEQLARAIVNHPLPIVVGVGHEVDFTIADFAADFRAPTPSAAAEVLSNDREELLDALATQRLRLEQAWNQQLQRLQRDLGHLRQRLRHPGSRLREQAQRLDEIELRLKRALSYQLEGFKTTLEHQTQRLRAYAPGLRIDRQGEKLGTLRRTLEGAMNRRLGAAQLQLERQEQLLGNLNPLAILHRGYAVLYDQEGKLVRAARDTRPGENLRAVLGEGELQLGVLGEAGSENKPS